jgi:hypothetical protein
MYTKALIPASLAWVAASTGVTLLGLVVRCGPAWMWISMAPLSRSLLFCIDLPSGSTLISYTGAIHRFKANRELKSGHGLDNDKHPTAMHNDYTLPVPAKGDSDIIDLAKIYSAITIY